MARYGGGGTATIAGTSVRPIQGLLSTASVSPILREIHLSNTTSTATNYRLVRFTGGTAGTDLNEIKYRQGSPAASCVLKAGWTADATVDETIGNPIHVPGVVGAEIIVTFGDSGIEGVVGSTKGLGLIPSGTGQICEVGFVWDE